VLHAPVEIAAAFEEEAGRLLGDVGEVFFFFFADVGFGIGVGRGREGGFGFEISDLRLMRFGTGKNAIL
jgi:hypothetical protein